MTEWTLHQPAFDGDAPEGVGLDTHDIRVVFGHLICDGRWNKEPNWLTRFEYRYRPRMEDVKG